MKKKEGIELILNELQKKPATRYELIEKIGLKKSTAHVLLAYMQANKLIYPKQIIYGRGRPQFVFYLNKNKK